VFKQLTDPRMRRGIRHRFDSICALTFLGLLARITEMAVLVRWADAHWDVLKEPLGFTRDAPPSATCISRSLAKLSLTEFRKAFAEFINLFVVANNDSLDSVVSASIDGKTCCQGYDENGDPEIMLNVFVHDIKLAVTQFQVGKDKTNEPGALKKNINEFVALFPSIKLLTGDAIFLQRPLLEVLQENNIDYIFQVKANQPDTYEALKECFADSQIDVNKPHAETIEKKTESRRGGCGVTVSKAIG
jgi:hypothetical protein